MASSNGYALDLWSPARHVASELERAAPAALSVQALAENYRHPIPADLFRVQTHEGCASDAEATRWLIEQVVGELQRRGEGGVVQLVEEDGGFRFADGITFDDLRFRRKKLVRTGEDPVPYWGEPFDPMSGEFSTAFGIEAKRMDPRDSSLAELRESLGRFGWLKELPAVRDQRGVLIVGHRRWKLADELGIPESERAVLTIHYEAGDEGDRRRLIAAVYSNVGAKAFTKEEWKHLARYMRAEGETIQAIADALDKPVGSVFNAVKDTETFSDSENVVDTLGRKKKQGRKKNFTPEQEAELIRLHFDEGVSIRDAEIRVRGTAGSSKHQGPSTPATKIIDQERGRREALQTQTEATQADAPSEPRVKTHLCPSCGFEHPIAS